MSIPGPIPVIGLRLSDWPILDQVPSSWHMLETPTRTTWFEKASTCRCCSGHHFNKFFYEALLPSVSLYLCIYKMTSQVNWEIGINMCTLMCIKWMANKNLLYKKVNKIKFKNSKKKKWHHRDFPGGAVVKNLPANAGDTGLSPGLGRSHMLWRN